MSSSASCWPPERRAFSVVLQVLVIAEFFQRGDHRLFGGGVLRRQLGGSSIGLGLNEIRLQQVGHRRSLVLGRLGVLIPQFFDPDARHV